MERLSADNQQLHQAVVSYAVVDQAIGVLTVGVLTVVGQVAPWDGFTVLREVSQHTNTRMSAVAEHIRAASPACCQHCLHCPGDVSIPVTSGAVVVADASSS
ncbi:ANTAR domain-containing protein [Streptomyces sp. NBC_01017]|uniref:ANTAR domain-containing protein n=1 Tax=Streptomyces sp. NBC_00180 TaxID=2903632 RepID=A0AAU1IC30_9ACTN|nr:ANTAR domain-containing protein [Streptomyces sp. NBC_01017]